MPAGVRIARAVAGDDIEAARALMRDYVASLGVDLSYQNVAAELAELPGAYAPPAGALLLARAGDGAARGCVAIRPMDIPGCCEMKRLYVAPAARGTGLGRGLAEAAIAEATRLGHREMRLDSLPGMAEARALYARLGFRVIAPYYPTPIAGTVFMAKRLSSAA
jgi:GNAT superfamily N-acetyltransferase